MAVYGIKSICLIRNLQSFSLQLFFYKVDFNLIAYVNAYLEPLI